MNSGAGGPRSASSPRCREEFCFKPMQAPGAEGDCRVRQGLKKGRRCQQGSIRAAVSAQIVAQRVWMI